METGARAMLSRILVPLDGSDHAERALPYARALGGPGTEVVLLAVVPRAQDVRNVFGTTVASPGQVEEGYEHVARDNLERAAAGFVGRQVVRREIATGDAAEQILRVATEHDVDLIAMSALGRGAFGGWARGGTADRVVRAARRPVLIVHPRGTTEGIGALVVPVDGSEAAAGALPVAAALALAVDVPVRVLRVVPEVAPEERWFPATPDDGEGRAAARRGVEATVARLGDVGVSATGDVLDGDPASSVIAATRPDEVVVLTSHGETEVGEWALGGVADKLLRHGAVPVVLVPVAGQASADALATDDGGTAPTDPVRL